MEIIANIDEKDLKGAIDNDVDLGEWIRFAENIVNSVFMGKKLPKGHGRLGDIDFEIKHYESILDNPTPDINRYDRENAPVILKALRMIGTVIEADRAENEGKK